jgi:N-acetylmuramoyl-L-alanine amidase
MMRPSKLAAALLASALLVVLTPASQAKRTVAQKKQIARTQFEEAERLREALNGKPERSRTKRDFQRVMDAYRKVYYVAPTSSRADASALAVADLMVDYGRRFDDEKSFKDAIAQYEFLRREYPGSRYRIEALFTIAQVLREDLDDQEKAKSTFEDVARKYPGTDLAQQAKDALAEMAQAEKDAKAAAKQPKKKKAEQEARKAKSAPKDIEQDLETINQAAGAQSAPAAQPVAAVKRAKLPLVTSIRQWATPDYTRVAIDLEDEVKYEAGRVSGPDRIFFDLHDAKLAPELIGKSFEVNGDGLLKKVRVAQFSLTMTRVVLEVDSLAEYSAFLLPNPYRLIIDIHGKQQVPVSVAKSEEPAKPTVGTKTDIGATKKESTYISSGQPVPASKSDDPTKELAESNAPITRELAKNNPTDVRATTAPTSAPTVEVVAPRSTKKGKKGKGKEADEASAVPPPKEADPLSGGDRSLIRALGLKIGRIVVDAGHGGHDTGTIGPNGLLEKDLVLDVATRLGKLLEQKLGAEVVYTRDDDTFIPLETRTAIANKHEADLFISVHANSSRDPKARGVETYYLNFTSDSEALDVAARENAVSEKSVFELSDLVKKIALKEKIEESREFASDVQGALFSGLALKNAGLRNRGVKKAPFVVLIGANMPSILAEISFVSNPQDERRLKTPEYRQKIAESLFKGVNKYANGLSGVKNASKLRADAAGGGSGGQ